MIYGYISVCSRGTFNKKTLNEQRNIINKRYPSAEISEEIYENPKKRVILEKLIKNLRSGDILVIYSLDRIASTIKEATHLINIAINKGIRINIVDMGMIDNTYAGKNIINILNLIVDFEKNTIIERTQCGKFIAKEKDGFKEGRPNKFSVNQLDEALALLKENSYKEVEKITGISKSTLIRAKRKTKQIESNTIE